MTLKSDNRFQHKVGIKILRNIHQVYSNLTYLQIVTASSDVPDIQLHAIGYRYLEENARQGEYLFGNKDLGS